MELDINTIVLFFAHKHKAKIICRFNSRKQFLPQGILAGILSCFFLSSLAVLPRAQSRDYPLRSDACNRDQFLTRAEGVGTRMLGLSFFILFPL